MDPVRDSVLVENTPIDYLDFASPVSGLGSKIGHVVYPGAAHCGHVEVIDIGINNAVEDYFSALEEHKPDLFGMSALLTTTMGGRMRCEIIQNRMSPFPR